MGRVFLVINRELGSDFVAKMLRPELCSDLRALDRVRIEGRDVRLGVFPMGVDASALGVAAGTPEVADAMEAIRRESGGRALGLALDRFDHTAGIARRLEALDRLMHRQPELRDQLRVFQIAMPLRDPSDLRRRLLRRRHHRRRRSPTTEAGASPRRHRDRSRRRRRGAPQRRASESERASRGVRGVKPLG